MEINNKAGIFAQLRKKLESYTPLSDNEFELIAPLHKEKHFNKGEVILKEGQICKTYYFIVSGCVRGFSIKDGREINVNFYIENDIASDFESYRTEQPSDFYFVAMENCVVLCGNKADTYPVFRDNESLHMFLFRFFQSLYFQEEKHSNTFKLLSPEERYHYLVNNEPHLIQRIPLIHLASYLGISRETLNRIRRQTS